jgi:membrane protein CcdC involved in cytochrome C biogenesis
VYQVYKAKLIPAFGITIGLLAWIFTHLSESTQQILAYFGVGAVIAVLIWGMWKFRAKPERKSEPPNG